MLGESDFGNSLSIGISNAKQYLKALFNNLSLNKKKTMRNIIIWLSTILWDPLSLHSFPVSWSSETGGAKKGQYNCLRNDELKKKTVETNKWRRDGNKEL